MEYLKSDVVSLVPGLICNSQVIVRRAGIREKLDNLSGALQDYQSVSWRVYFEDYRTNLKKRRIVTSRAVHFCGLKRKIQLYLAC